MITGLVIGKFYPFHCGHQYLIEEALKQCDFLCVLVVDGENETPDADERADWIVQTFEKQLHNMSVITISDIKDDNNSEAWAKHTLFSGGFTKSTFSKVFTSEDYGDAYAKYLGAEHVCVDKARKLHPCSGSLIRSNPLEQWGFLSTVVKAYYAMRICVVGAESTGTTTLAKELAKYYSTLWVGEYGRFYVETRGLEKSWSSEEFEHIANMQCSMEDYIAKDCNRLLICDTDVLATKLWHHRYLGTNNKNIDRLLTRRNFKGLKKSLYILTGDEIPFVQDGTRDGEHIRHSMHEDFITTLKSQEVPWILVQGSVTERLVQSTRVIDKLIRGDTIE